MTKSTEFTKSKRLWILLCYLSWLAAVPLAIEWRDREVMWNARQGFLLAVVEYLGWKGFGWIYPVVESFGGAAEWKRLAAFCAMLGVVIVVPALHCACIAEGWEGKRIRIPFLAWLADWWIDMPRRLRGLGNHA